MNNVSEDSHSKQSVFINGLKGMAMGIAEVIPGVSGGTIAFITGIYEQFIDLIKSFDLSFFKQLFSRGPVNALGTLDLTFMISLLLGMIVGVGVGVFGMTALIENYPEILWAFFFGLIIGSAVFIYNLISSWGIKETVLLLIGLGIGYWITSLSPVAGSINPFYVFLCGFIAISALILPGLSGSFLLLILGMYTTIIPMVKELITDFSFDILQTLGIFAVGAICGLVLFSRVLSYAFRHYEDLTLAALCGLMLGSLNKIWPWRNPEQWIDEGGKIIFDIPSDTHHFKVAKEVNVLPGQYDGTSYFWWCIAAGFIGFIIVIALDMASRQKDIEA